MARWGRLRFTFVSGFPRLWRNSRLPCSVSISRSSNRTGGFPASGSRTSVMLSPTSDGEETVPGSAVQAHAPDDCRDIGRIIGYSCRLLLVLPAWPVRNVPRGNRPPCQPGVVCRSTCRADPVARNRQDVSHPPQSRPANPRYSMLPFLAWLENRSQEPSQADRLATLIAGGGPAGVSLDDLSRSIGPPPESLRDILRALV